jgi:phosphoribosylformylglycinamidine synthase subunit PurQ / glutaminase
MSRPPILILHASGTNRDREAAWACEMAGGAPEVVHLNRLYSGEISLNAYRMVVLPGGFSYGDDLGAGKLWAVGLRYHLGEVLAEFVASGRPVLGICNGFQALVKSGILPGPIDDFRSQIEDYDIARQRSSNFNLQSAPQLATLARNDSARFECRWVYLRPEPVSPCVFTRGLGEPIRCPIAHGEGKFVARDAATLAEMEVNHLPALRYCAPTREEQGDCGRVPYPWNPNGSTNGIAGICNPAGNVLGLMPHPEDHITAEQNPEYHRGGRGLLGLPLFVNGVRYAAQI